MSDSSLNSLAQSDDSMPSLPAGNMMTAGPTPALAGTGGDLMGSIANAVQSAVGYATQNPALQQQAIDRESQNAKYRLLMPVGKALGDAQARLAEGDIAGANAAYQKIAHLGIAIPAVQAFGTHLAEQAFNLRQRAAQAAAIASPNFTGGVAAQPGQLTEQPAEGEDVESRAFLSRTAGTPGTPATDNRPQKLATLIAMGMDPEKASKLVFPGLQHLTMDDGSIAVFDPQSGRVVPVVNGMGKVMGENIATRDANGNTRLTPMPKTHVVEGSIVQTGVNAEGTPTAQTIFQAPPPLAPALMEHMAPSDVATYKAAVAQGRYDVADQIVDRAHQSFFASQVPGEQKALIQRVPGVTQADLADIQQGKTSDRIQQIRTAAAQVGIRDEEIKKAQELATTKAINMEQDTAAKVFPHYTSYADKDGNIVPNATSLSGAEVTRRMQRGELFGVTADQDNRLRMMANLTPQLDTQRANIPRLFAGVQPGSNLGNALSLKAREIGGDGVARLMDSTNFDVAGEQVKILTGSSRGSQRMFELYMKEGGGTLSKTDTPESALAKNEFAANATRNAKLTTSGQAPMKTLDPYQTNPILREAQTRRAQGHQVVVSVDRQGNWTIVDKTPNR